ncbi:MAG: hypothetical protein QGH74_02570 [Candidatus Brocadiia bacterium]|nr:hypothetical protein [Candidatus Brocadiia bacterium]
MTREECRSRCGLAVTILAAGGLVACAAAPRSAGQKPEAGRKIFGHDTIIAFYGDYRKDVPSQNFVATGTTWYNILKTTVDKGSDVIAQHPGPVLSIDEFGFDYGGGIDQKTAQVLRAAKGKNPELKIAVWQMRGPVAPTLAEAYRETVDLVMMESYASLEDPWVIPAQLTSARLNGLVDRTIIGLGLGAESEVWGGHYWTRTKEELEEQVRLIRYVAPESPGVTFFGQAGHYARGKEGVTITLKDVEAVVSKFREYPTDGSGISPEVMEVAKQFTKRYEKPALACSPSWVQPNYSAGKPGPDGKWIEFGPGSTSRPPKDPSIAFVRPITFRAFVMNLGEKDATNVRFRLKNPGPDGDVFADATVDVLPARSITIAVMPLLPDRTWEVWSGRWKLLVDAPGCEVMSYNHKRLEE